MSEHPKARALAEITRELRDEPAPNLDWNAVEEQMMERLQSAPATSDRTAVPWVVGLGGLAAAAAAALWLGTGTHREAPPQPPPVASFTSGALNGNELPVGHAVVADTRAVRVEHPGRATWTLAPGSSGHIAAQGRYLTVALARGSVLAEVVPGQAAESFAVEARETRIAAHGTVFRVTLDGDQVDVQVSEGEVVVGSAEDRGETRGFHLAAPGHGTFPLDGARVGRISPPSEGVEAPQQQLPLAAPPPRQPARPPLPVASSQAPAAAGPTVETVTDRIVEELRSCFVRNTQVQGSVHVSATSTISVTFVGGSVDRLQIDPPLAPDVERCVRAAAHGVSIPNGAEATISREVWLSR